MPVEVRAEYCGRYMSSTPAVLVYHPDEADHYAALVPTAGHAHGSPNAGQTDVFATAAGVLLASWGVFIRLNRSAEELEPEAMEETKSEDRKVK